MPFSLFLRAASQDAVNQLARGTVDAVVTTLDREQIDGWELLKAMRSNERLKNIPVIGLAADAGADFRTNHDGLEIEHIQHAADRAGLLQSIGTLIRKAENALAIAG